MSQVMLYKYGGNETIHGVPCFYVIVERSSVGQMKALGFYHSPLQAQEAEESALVQKKSELEAIVAEAERVEEKPKSALSEIKIPKK